MSSYAKAQGVYSKMYMKGRGGGGGLVPDIFYDAQKINTKQNQTPKNKSIKITDPQRKINPLCNLRDEL